MNQKLLSLIVPAYQSEDYLSRCVDTLLLGGDEVEILLVNDGSIDKTAEIIEGYAQRHPGMVRVFHQENQGHGGAVNTGISNATGLYTKVVDSDDWLDGDAFQSLLEHIRLMRLNKECVDLLVWNYVYERDGKRNKRVVRYGGVFPENQTVTWNETGRFALGQYLLMHSMVLKTQVILDSELRLPIHCFYVDNLYAFNTLPRVKTIRYLNLDLYRYYIGREDQSVQEKVMIRRIDQQIKVNKLMIDQTQKLDEVPGKLRVYLLHYLQIITTVTLVMLTFARTQEANEKKAELWAYLQQKNPQVHSLFKRNLMGLLAKSRRKTTYWLIRFLYTVARKHYGFN